MKPSLLNIKFFLTSWLLVSTTYFLFSQNTSAPNASASARGWIAKPFERKAFIENKGQFAADLPQDKTNYSYAIDNGARILFSPNEVLFCFSKLLLDKDDMKEKEDQEEEREREMKMQQPQKQFISMKWLNANPDATIEVSDKQSVDYGYVISKNVPKNYTAHCKGYSKLKIKNLYKGIDAEYFFTEKEGFKYNLYIAPDADISQIQQYYEGMENIRLSEGNIIIKTLLGDIIDHAPLSYVMDNANQKITSSFTLKKNVVSFNIENNLNQSITIDPWVTTPTMNYAPGDNGVDQYGNSYVTNGHYILEKYSPTGTLISSTDVMGGIAPYYGDMTTDSRGYCFFNTMGGHARGDATGIDSAGNFLWDSFGIMECWRFVLNECTNQVLSLTGYRHSATGFAKINTETGALTGYTQSGSCCQDPHCGAIDYNGDVYCVVSEYGGGTVIYKWTPANTLAATYPVVGSWGYGTGYVSSLPWTQGYNGMTILGNNLYIFDGATLFKVNKTNGSIVNQITVPGGINKHNGGIYITSCGKTFVGSGTGVYMYDINFNQIDFKATTGAVYDLAFNAYNQTINACGPGHITELAFTIPPCVFQTQPVVQPSCGGLPNGYIKLNLTGGVPDYTYAWSINDNPLIQTTDSIGNLAPGSYKCVYTDNKCPIPNIDSTIVVVPSVITTADFVFQDVCNPLPVVFTDSSQVNYGSFTSWSWKLGDTSTSAQQNLSHTYSGDGTYSVTLLVTTSDGCKDSTTKNVTIHPKPDADFTFTNKCQGTTLPVNSASTINSPDSITSWNWNFGDNTTGTGNNTGHLYASTGNFNTTLIINSNNLCADTVTHQVTVFNNPVAAFTFSDVCLGDSMYFNNTSTVNTPASISAYLWDYGNGTTSNIQNPGYKYSLPGTYTVILVTTTADGCSDAATSPVNTFDPPVSNFTINDVCLFDTAIFNNSSANPTMGTIASWAWNFGDGTPLNSIDSNPLHLYADTGTFFVSLITRSSNLACADTALDTLTVFPMPIADFTAADVCLGQSMNFFDSSTVTGNCFINAWSWDFDDNTSLSAAQNPVHNYNAFGAYTITFIAVTNHQCKDTLSNTVVVHPLPDAAFSANNVCLGDTTFFYDLSAIQTNVTFDSISFWYWNFGDNSLLANTQNTTHLYAAIGTDSVQLKVVSTFGCADSALAAVVVNPNPAVGFSATDTAGCEPLCIDFSNSSTIASGNNNSWTWNFGDGNTVNNNTLINHCFYNDSVFNPKFYTISLTVTSDSGCVSSLTKNNYITVYAAPDALFSVLPATATITYPVIEITNLSTGANSWFWNFGDTDTSSSPAPAPHTYADTGTYNVRLITTTLYGCIDSTYQTVIIEPDFMFYIPSAFSPNDDGINDTFIGRGMFINDFEMTIFDRWGNLIYRTDDVNKPWDGKANYGNEPAQADVYIYSFKITDFKSIKHNYKGTVTLIR